MEQYILSRTKKVNKEYTLKNLHLNIRFNKKWEKLSKKWVDNKNSLEMLSSLMCKCQWPLVKMYVQRKCITLYF